MIGAGGHLLPAAHGTMKRRPFADPRKSLAGRLPLFASGVTGGLSATSADVRQHSAGLADGTGALFWDCGKKVKNIGLI
jgi:hypothetical protein